LTANKLLLDKEISRVTPVTVGQISADRCEILAANAMTDLVSMRRGSTARKARPLLLWDRRDGVSHMRQLNQRRFTMSTRRRAADLSRALARTISPDHIAGDDDCARKSNIAGARPRVFAPSTSSGRVSFLIGTPPIRAAAAAGIGASE